MVVICTKSAAHMSSLAGNLQYESSPLFVLFSLPSPRPVRQLPDGQVNRSGIRLEMPRAVDDELRPHKPVRLWNWLHRWRSGPSLLS